MAQKKIPLAGQDEVPPTERLATSFKNLVTSSSELNSATEELNTVIATFEKHLASIKPPVATWHRLASGDDNGAGNYEWHRDIGYADVKGEWGIALRTVEAYFSQTYDESVEMWRFKDAPQWMQIESVSKLPDLFEEIVKRTQDTTKKLRAKTEEARVLADALSKAAFADLL